MGGRTDVRIVQAVGLAILLVYGLVVVIAAYGLLR